MRGFKPEPSTVKFLLRINVDASVIVWPASAGSKFIVPPGARFAIASRRLPGPLSARLVTIRLRGNTAVGVAVLVDVKVGVGVRVFVGVAVLVAVPVEVGVNVRKPSDAMVNGLSESSVAKAV